MTRWSDLARAKTMMPPVGLSQIDAHSLGVYVSLHSLLYRHLHKETMYAEDL